MILRFQNLGGVKTWNLNWGFRICRYEDLLVHHKLGLQGLWVLGFWGDSTCAH